MGERVFQMKIQREQEILTQKIITPHYFLITGKRQDLQ